MLQDSSIIIRIQKFLAPIHPFCFISKDHLYQLSSHTDVGVYKANTQVFGQGLIPKDSFFVVKKGAVNIVEETDGAQLLIDKCGEGDMFGLRPLLAESSYRYTALCAEDTIIY